MHVAPFAGAWIEITLWLPIETPVMSLPSRERGLKFDYPGVTSIGAFVAPFAGAWIEILPASRFAIDYFLSLPSRERGLKSSVTREFFSV